MTAPRVFVSHRHADMDRATAFAAALRERGLDAWLDEWEIGLGDDIVVRMEQGLADSDGGCILLSEAGVGEGWMREELSVLTQRAVELEKRLIPVLLDDIPPDRRPPFLQTRKAATPKDLGKIVAAFMGRSNKPPLGPSP